MHDANESSGHLTTGRDNEVGSTDLVLVVVPAFTQSAGVQRTIYQSSTGLIIVQAESLSLSPASLLRT